MPKSLRQLFAEQYKLCKLTPAETVAVISEHGHKQEYVDAAVDAARDLGASVLVLTASSLSQPNLPPYEADGREVPALLAAAAETDLVIDVTVGGLIHSSVRTRITGNGKRMLFVAEPADVLERLMGNEELRKVVEVGGRKLKAAQLLRVIKAPPAPTSTADISGEDLPVTHQWGYVDEPGRWDHWPSGFVACFPRTAPRRARSCCSPADALIPGSATCATR